MRVVLQRVKHASVEIDGQLTGAIERGYLLLVGFGRDDVPEKVVRMVQKIKKLRLFEDENGKTNLSIFDVGGEVLSVSQFTLLADCSHGNRPSFTKAAKPQEANRLYELFNSELRAKGLNVQTGVFGADMKVGLINDGPFTVVLE